MKRILIVLLIIFSIFVLLGVGVYVFIKNFDINQYRSQIVAKISESLEREVELEDIAMSLSLEKGSQVKLTNLVIKAKSEDFFKDEILIKNAFFDFNLNTFIKTKKIEVNSMNFNFEEFMLYFKEQQLNLPVDRLKITVEDFAFDQPFSIKITASVLSQQENVSLEAIAVANEKDKSLISEEIKIFMNLALLDSKLLEKSFDQFSDLGIKMPVKGEVYTVVRDVYVDETSLRFSVNTRLKEGLVKLDSVGLPFENMDASLMVEPSKMTLEHFNFNFADGKVGLNLDSMDYMKSNDLNFQLLLENLKLEQLLADQKLPLEVIGLLSGNLKGSAKGLTPEVLTTSLDAKGQVDIISGKLLDFNLLSFVIKKISSVSSDLRQNIDLYLNDKYREVLKSKDTTINLFKLTPVIKDGYVYFNDSKIEADGFKLLVTARLDFDKNINLSGSLQVDKDLTQILIQADDDLEYFVDQGNIKIPLLPFSGKLDKIRVYPDIASLGKQVIQNKGKDELRKAIFKALDIEEAKSQPTTEGSIGSGQPSDTAPSPREKKPEEVLIENILNTIPLFK